MDMHDQWFNRIRELVMCHSPSGVEREIDAYLLMQFEACGVKPIQDASGNILVRIAGRGGGRLAITAHKDEIGALVTAVQPGGKLKLKKLGGSFPWVYGEGVVDILGDVRCVSGVLSFGSRHISHISPQFAHKDAAPVKWEDAWIETKLSDDELNAAGVHAGSRVVVGRHRKEPFRLGQHIASYTLDNKASLAILLELARCVRDPLPEVVLVASAREEVGGVGALYFTHHERVDALIALEIAPLASEYPIAEGDQPVLLFEDAFGLYDDGLTSLIRAAAMSQDIAVQSATMNGFGSDGSIAMKFGHVPKGACLAFPTQNTHGYEIASLQSLIYCTAILKALCQDSVV